MTNEIQIKDSYGLHWVFDGEKIRCVEADDKAKENGDLEFLEENGYYCDSLKDGIKLLVEYGYILSEDEEAKLKKEIVENNKKLFEVGSHVNILNTCLQGIIFTTYDELVKLFGLPTYAGSECDKSDANWFVKFRDGNVATIYNWKNGYNYCGEAGIPVEDIKEWHIGGHKSIVVEHIRKIINSQKLELDDEDI